MNRAVLVCWTSTGVVMLNCEYPTLVEARRAGRKLVELGQAWRFRVWRRDADGGEVRLVRQQPDTARGTPGTKACRALRPGMTGVRVPGHIGTWKVLDTIEGLGHGETVHLATVEHERFRNARLAVDVSTRRVYAIIRPGWQDELKKKGIDLK